VSLDYLTTPQYLSSKKYKFGVGVGAFVKDFLNLFVNPIFISKEN